MADPPSNSADSVDSTVAEAVRPSRRKFLQRAAAGALAAGAGTLLYTWRLEPHWVEVIERSLPIENLPESLVGKRLVHLSDLHIGDVVDHDYITNAIASTAKLEPDLFVITGDLMTCYGAEQIPQVADVLASLPAAKLGRFAILGNHDYGVRWQQHSNPRKLSVELDKLDIRLLRNETVDAGGLQIVGIDDLWSRRFAPRLARLTLDPDRAYLTLCHNPDSLDYPDMLSLRGWVLAGHTHGGQCKPPFAGPPILPVRNKRYTSGEIAVDEHRKLYINRGLGYTHRVRFNCRPEVTVFTLEGASRV